MGIGKRRQEGNLLSVTSQIIEKINNLRNNNYIPLKLEFNSQTYLQVLKECNFVKEEDGEYFWHIPGLVYKYNSKHNLNAFYGIPFIINDEGFDWAIISEEKDNG